MAYQGRTRKCGIEVMDARVWCDDGLRADVGWPVTMQSTRGLCLTPRARATSSHEAQLLVEQDSRCDRARARAGRETAHVARTRERPTSRARSGVYENECRAAAWPSQHYL